MPRLDEGADSRSLAGVSEAGDAGEGEDVSAGASGAPSSVHTLKALDGGTSSVALSVQTEKAFDAGNSSGGRGVVPGLSCWSEVSMEAFSGFIVGGCFLVARKATQRGLGGIRHST